MSANPTANGKGNGNGDGREIAAMLTEDQFSPDTISVDALRSTFEAAYFETSIDSEGDLIVRDNYRVIVLLPSRDMIRFFCLFRFRASDEDDEARLRLINKINDDLPVVRATVSRKDALILDWYVPVRGGITKKAIVLALRTFVNHIGQIGGIDTEDLLA